MTEVSGSYTKLATFKMEMCSHTKNKMGQKISVWIAYVG